jgi:hypothetical protein
MQVRETYKKMTKPYKILFWSVFLLICYTVFGFLILPPITRVVAEKQLSKAVGRPLTIEKVRMNPFTLTATVTGFTFMDAEGKKRFVAFDSLHVDLQAISLFKLAPVVREVKLVCPFLRIVHKVDYDLKEGFNFSDLLILQPFLTRSEEEAPEPEPETEEKEPFAFAVYNIQVVDGTIKVDDLPVQKHHVIDSINLGIPFVSSLESDLDVFVQPHFAAVVNGAPFELGGKTKPFSESLNTEIDIDLANIDMPYYFAYSPMKSLVKLEKGTLDIQGKLEFNQHKNGKQEAFLSGTVSIRNLAINDPDDQHLARIDGIDIVLARSELLSGKVHFEKIQVDKPEMNVTRNREGVVNILCHVAGP